MRCQRMDEVTSNTMKPADINCKCGKCGITVADGEAKLYFQCGCEDCRQALCWGYARGGIKPNPLPKLYYMSADIIDVRGQKHMKCYQLRDEEPGMLGVSRRVYCDECYSVIGVDHPAYEEAVFLNFPEHSDNRGDLSAPLAAYVMMIDYTEATGPMPVEEVPLFTTMRFKQEADRLFAIPAVSAAFTRREKARDGISFSELIDQIGGTVILGLEPGTTNF